MDEKGAARDDSPGHDATALLPSLGTIIFMIVRVVGCLVCCTAGMLSQSMEGFSGSWVYRVDGQNLMKFDIQMAVNSGTAVVTHPKKMSFSQDGIGSAGGAEYVTEKPEPFTIESATLKFANGVVITQTDESHATLTLAPQIRPLPLVRIPNGQTAELAKLREWPPEIQALRKELAGLVEDDQDARNTFDEKRMLETDTHAQPEVIRIMDKFGWVTKSLAGADAAHEFWLLVQHQDLAIQQRGLTAMKKAADVDDASKTDYAYLYDRVQTRSGNPQHFGTQTQCTAGGAVALPSMTRKAWMRDARS